MATNTWPLAEAKAKLSEVGEKALKMGPQVITRHGKPTFVLMDIAEFDRMKAPKRTWGDVLTDPRFYKSGLKIERMKGVIRPVEF